MNLEDSSNTLDLIFQELGPWNKYNVFTYIVILIPILCTGMYASQFNFIAGDINYRCKIPECEAIDNDKWINWAIPSDGNNLNKCQRYDSILVNTSSSNIYNNVSCTEDIFERNTTLPCDQIVYDAENTIVREFDIGCQEWKRTLVGSMHNAGFFVSISMTGIFSDRFGRKTCIVVASILNGLLGVLRSFSTNYLMFVSLEFLETALGGGLYTTCFILMVEIATPRNRVKMNSILNVVFSLGLSIPPTLAWIIHDWRINLRIMYLPALVLIIYIWILDESTRWLLVNGNKDKATTILKKAAKCNKVVITDTLITKLGNVEKNSRKISMNIQHEDFIKTTANVESKSNLMKVLTSKIIMRRVVICSFLWVACTFTYYGLSINSVSLSGNKYLNYILVSLVEIPSHLVGMFLVDLIGRRRTLISCFSLSGICCILQAYTPKDLSVAALILYLGGKFFITLAYVCFYVYVSEIFPTNVRQSLLSCCSTIGRIGSVLAPQIPLMSHIMETLPSLLFGGLALGSGILSFTLPETTNRKLPDTIEEAEEISR